MISVEWYEVLERAREQATQIRACSAQCCGECVPVRVLTREPLASGRRLGHSDVGQGCKKTVLRGVCSRASPRPPGAYPGQAVGNELCHTSPRRSRSPPRRDSSSDSSIISGSKGSRVVWDSAFTDSGLSGASPAGEASSVHSPKQAFCNLRSSQATWPLLSTTAGARLL